MKTKGKTPQEKGRQFEVDFGKKYGGEGVPGSGNGIWKLDIDSNKFLFSLKHTENESVRLTKDILDEAKRAVYGSDEFGVGIGGEYIPAVVLKIESSDDEYVVMRMQDLVAICQTEITSEVFSPSKKQVDRKQAELPTILRRAESSE